ncbi:MAG: ABC transporter permease [Bacteroidota bacterium]
MTQIPNNLNLPFFIARRYLFARKSHNIINVISAISAMVIAFVTMAMVVVLSVFNGIEGLVEKLYNTLDSELVISPEQGKRFDSAAFPFAVLDNSDVVQSYSRVIEDEVLIQYNGRQTVAALKGVDDNFFEVANLDSAIVEGRGVLHRGNIPFAVLGAGLRYQLSMPHTEELLRPLEIYALPKGKSIKEDKEAAFEEFPVNVSGVFSVNADFDMKYVFVPLSFAKNCFNYDTELTAIEIKLKPGISQEEAKTFLAEKLGKSYKLTTRQDKNAIIFQTSRTEKWITFFILIFIVFIAAFNILASLTMLIIEKKTDLNSLRSMGMEKIDMVKMFFYQSLMINAYGTIAGLVLGLGFCWAQLTFGLIRFTGSIVEFYPVEVQVLDVFAIISVISVIAAVSFFGVRFLIRMHLEN